MNNFVLDTSSPILPNAFQRVAQIFTDTRASVLSLWPNYWIVNVAVAMALYGFPSLADQASPTWLGGGAAGGATKALTETAKFLKDEGRIQQVAPDYSKSVNAAFVQGAMK